MIAPLLVLLVAAQQAPPSQAPAPAPALAAPVEVPLVDQRALTLAMARLVTEHPDLLSSLPVGRSRDGARIEALRLAAGERNPGRPAILVVADLDGPLAWTSGLALYEVQRLVQGYASDTRIRALLDTTTLYVIPRANPDAAEARFQKPLRELRGTGASFDDDHDGLLGEGPSEDVDGDGLVTWMRVADPAGEWTEDPADPRVLVRADPARGERGRWRLFPEGRDRDGDELAGEDPEKDAVVNRNFPAQWEEHVPAAGVFPTDEPEARALVDFLLAHEDVQAVLTYGELDDLVEKPDSVAEDAPRKLRLPPPGYLRSDADVLGEVGRRYRELTSSKAKGEGTRAGAFQTWCYEQRGLWTLNVVPWSIPLDVEASGDKGGEASEGGKDASEAASEGGSAPRDAQAAVPEGGAKRAGGKRGKPDEGERKPSDDAKRLRWIDAQKESARFVPWRPFEHPELGPVEIGGFAPYAKAEPPQAELAPLAERQLEFLLALGQMLARVRVERFRYRAPGEGLLELELTLGADGLLPVRSKAALRAETPRAIRVRLELPEGARVLSGEPRTLVRELEGPSRTAELRWLVAGADPSAVRVVLESDHAGTAAAAPEARR